MPHALGIPAVCLPPARHSDPQQQLPFRAQGGDVILSMLATCTSRFMPTVIRDACEQKILSLLSVGMTRTSSESAALAGAVP